MKRILRSSKDYKENIGDIHDRITSIIQKSVEDWNKIKEFSHGNLDAGFVSYQPRTAAGIVHDHICQRVFNEFYADPDVKVGYFNGVFGFLFKNLFFIRFKKMNEKNFKFAGRNTNQSFKYQYQSNSIPGLPEQPTILYSGYSLDKTGALLNGIYTACWDGNDLVWIDQHGVNSAEQTSLSFELEDGNKKQVEIEKTIKRVTAKQSHQQKIKNTGTSN